MRAAFSIQTLATGVRLEEYPFTPARVLTALNGANSKGKS